LSAEVPAEPDLEMPDRIDDKQWQRFLEEGYLLLGAVLDDAELNTLKTRIDDIMQGKVELPYDRMMMQLDGKSSCYREMEPMTKGHKGQTLNYRKITELELDPFFLAFMQKPLFRAICARAHGPSTPISTPRAMFMNKPAETGTHLPWHHDVFVNLDIDPRIIVWTALDHATLDNGCLRVIPGSHCRGFGKANPTEKQVEKLLAESEPVALAMQAGEAVLLENSLIHTSGLNKTSEPRRAFSACYIDASTRANDGQPLPVIFGESALHPRSGRGD